MRDQLAPTGVLRAAINLSNFLLVTSRDEAGEPEGVSPAIARHLASKLGVPVRLVTYPGPGPLSDDLDNWDIGNIANEKAATLKNSSILQLCENEVISLNTKSSIKRFIFKSSSKFTLMQEYAIGG